MRFRVEEGGPFLPQLRVSAGKVVEKHAPPKADWRACLLLAFRVHIQLQVFAFLIVNTGCDGHLCSGGIAVPSQVGRRKAHVCFREKDVFLPSKE